MLRLIVLSIIASVVLLFSGCSCAFYPSTVLNSVESNGAGGAIVAYEYKRSDSDVEIHLQRLGKDSSIIWDRVMFASQHNRTVIEGMSGDCEGSITIAWSVLNPQNEDEGPYYFDHATIARVDVQGQTLWQRDINGEGLLLADCVSDGATAIWPMSGFTHVQRIDNNGKLTWEDDFSGSGYGLKLASNEVGETFILCDHYDMNYFVVQKIDSRGATLWGEEGVRIKYLDTASEQRPQLISYGSGGVIVTWAELTNFGQPCYIWMLRIGSDGQVMWKMPVRDLTSVINTYTRVVPDGSGGAIVFWEDLRDGMALYMQKVNSEGMIQWQDNGVPVCTDLPEVSPILGAVSNCYSGAILAWVDGDRKLYAQMIDEDGHKQFGANGVLIAEGVCSLPVMLSEDGEGGVIVGWAIGQEMYHPKQSYVQRINSDGELMWGNIGIEVAP